MTLKAKGAYVKGNQIVEELFPLTIQVEKHDSENDAYIFSIYIDSICYLRESLYIPLKGNITEIELFQIMRSIIFYNNTSEFRRSREALAHYGVIRQTEVSCPGHIAIRLHRRGGRDVILLIEDDTCYAKQKVTPLMPNTSNGVASYFLGRVYKDRLNIRRKGDVVEGIGQHTLPSSTVCDIPFDKPLSDKECLEFALGTFNPDSLCLQQSLVKNDEKIDYRISCKEGFEFIELCEYKHALRLGDLHYVHDRFLWVLIDTYSNWDVTKQSRLRSFADEPDRQKRIYAMFDFLHSLDG